MACCQHCSLGPGAAVMHRTYWPSGTQNLRLIQSSTDGGARQRNVGSESTRAPPVVRSQFHVWPCAASRTAAAAHAFLLRLHIFVLECTETEERTAWTQIRCVTIANRE